MRKIFDTMKKFSHTMKNKFRRYEKYLSNTRWKIFLRYTMKNFLYNENIFLHDKLFCKLQYRKFDQKDQNIFSTRCNFLRNEKVFPRDENMISTRSKYFFSVKTISL